MSRSREGALIHSDSKCTDYVRKTEFCSVVIKQDYIIRDDDMCF
jgi:hypothetical protein